MPPKVLSEETRKRLLAQHRDAIQRVVAAEAVSLGMMTEATQAATGRLIEANRRRAKTRDADESQRFIRQAIHQETGQLEDQFWEATTRGRMAARDLAQGQVGGAIAPGSAVSQWASAMMLR